MKRTSRIFLALIGVTALIAAGCGGDDDDATATPVSTSNASPTTAPAPTTTASPQASASATAANLQVVDSSLGKVLATSDGKTLYTFNNDAAGKSNCNGSCASTWPPLVTTALPPMPASLKGEFSLAARDDGQKQLALDSKPLYRYAADSASGDTKGEGVGGVWFAVRITPSTASASPVPGSDYGY